MKSSPAAGVSADPARPGKRWVRRKQARPEEITAAALELFVERGYVATRLEDVAARAGVSKGTVYLYFANKEDLFKAVVREGLVSPITEIRDLIEQDAGSTFDLLALLVRGWWARIGSTRVSGIPKLVLAESGNFPELARFYLSEVVEPGQAVIAGLVRRGIARGEFIDIDPDDAARLIAAPLLLTALWRNSLARFSERDFDPVQTLETHLAFLQRALTAKD